MAESKLSQAEIDALLASMHAPDEAQVEEEQTDFSSFDFRRPSKFAREHIRSLESAHEVFARRFTTQLTQSLRAVVSLDLLSLDQITYEDYVRSIPTPSVIATFGLSPLPGSMVLEMSTQMGLTLLDRLLGGLGLPVAMRRPTELESGLLHDLLGHAVPALTEAFEPMVEIAPELEGIEFNPQFVQTVAPTEMVLMLTFQVAMQTGVRTEGLLSLCYPFSTLAPAMHRLESHAWRSQEGPSSDEAPVQPLRELVPEVSVPLRVHLRASTVPAADLACLRPGDVVRLEHRVDEPAIATVGNSPLFFGRVGRKGRRLALEIGGWGS